MGWVQGTGFSFLILWRQTCVTLRQEIEESLKKEKVLFFCVLNALLLWVFLDYLLNEVQCLLLSIWGVMEKNVKNTKILMTFRKPEVHHFWLCFYLTLKDADDLGNMLFLIGFMNLSTTTWGESWKQLTFFFLAVLLIY